MSVNIKKRPLSPIWCWIQAYDSVNKRQDVNFENIAKKNDKQSKEVQKKNYIKVVNTTLIPGTKMIKIMKLDKDGNIINWTYKMKARAKAKAKAKAWVLAKAQAKAWAKANPGKTLIVEKPKKIVVVKDEKADKIARRKQKLKTTLRKLSLSNLDIQINKEKVLRKIRKKKVKRAGAAMKRVGGNNIKYDKYKQKTTFMNKMFLYSSPFITKLVCGFMKCGKKNIITKLWNKVFIKLKEYVRISPMLFFKRQILLYRPLFRMKKQNIGKSLVNVPLMISSGQQISMMYKIYIAFIKKQLLLLRNKQEGFDGKMSTILLFDFINDDWCRTNVFNEVYKVNKLAFKFKHYLMNKTNKSQYSGINIMVKKKKRISVPI